MNKQNKKSHRNKEQTDDCQGWGVWDGWRDGWKRWGGMWSITVRNCRAMDGFSTSCGEHTVRHINAESLHCIPETNMILYVNSIRKKEEPLAPKNGRKLSLRYLCTNLFPFIRDLSLDLSWCFDLLFNCHSK